MLWFFSAIGAMVADVFERFTHRVVMIKADYYVYSFLFNFIGLLFFLPVILFTGLQLPTEAGQWLLIILGSFLYVIITIIAFASYKYSELSAREPISTIKLVVVYGLSLLLLNETFNAGRLIGTLAIMAAIIVTTYEKGQKFKWRDKGVYLTIISSVLIGFTAIYEKYALSYFTPLTFSFFMFLGPSLGLLLFLGGKKSDLKFITSRKMLKFVAFSSLLCVISYFLKMTAFSLTDISLVYPVLSLSTVFTTIMGVWLLKERKNVPQKIAGALLAFAGAVIITLA